MALKRTKKFCKRCHKNITNNRTGFCNECEAYIAHQQYKAEDRPSATERGYDSKWKRFSKQYLEKHPICVMCGNPATVTDHKMPISIMLEIYGYANYDEELYQALCHSCNIKKGKNYDMKIKKQWEEDKRKMAIAFEED